MPPTSPATGPRPHGLALVAVSAGVVAGLALAAAAAPPPAAPPPPGPARAPVLEVLDGDTLRVRIGAAEEAVRLIGVDCPEISHPSRPVEFYGQEAADFVRGLVEKQAVTLTADSYSQQRDKYGRLLRYVTLPDAHLLNAVLIEEGYCYALTRFPFRRRSEFVRLEDRARRSGRGLWEGGGLAELRWIESQGTSPFAVYPMTRSSWAVRYGDRVSVRLSNSEMHRALEQIRRWSVELSPRDLETKLDREGWRRVPAAK